LFTVMVIIHLSLLSMMVPIQFSTALSPISFSNCLTLLTQFPFTVSNPSSHLPLLLPSPTTHPVDALTCYLQHRDYQPSSSAVAADDFPYIQGQSS
jgi:hypothetical protein